mmetsp:Transcript_49442/g.142177  ORF Transcript_49442/g.142177 Transcript_49442/m.142177 type:complete len:266 (+) Transcript_49442:394-1191(+)
MSSRSAVPLRDLAHQLGELLKVKRAVAVLVVAGKQLVRQILAHLSRPELVDASPHQDLLDLLLGDAVIVVLHIKRLEGRPKHMLLRRHPLADACGAELCVVEVPGAIEVQLPEHRVDLLKFSAILAEDLLEPRLDFVEIEQAVAVGVHLAEYSMHISEAPVVQLPRHRGDAEGKELRGVAEVPQVGQHLPGHCGVCIRARIAHPRVLEDLLQGRSLLRAALEQALDEVLGVSRDCLPCCVGHREVFPLHALQLLREVPPERRFAA